MTANLKQDSNSTGLSIAKETSLGIVAGDATTIWQPREPNSYKSFGPTYKLVARQPINASRQQRKGVITDLDAAADWQEDLTYNSVQELAEGIFFAAFHRKNELAVPTVDPTAGYEPASGGGSYHAGDLVAGKLFSNAINNGLGLVSGTPTASSVEVSGKTLVTEASSLGVISRCGVQFASGDATLTYASGIMTLGTTTKDLTTLGLIVGEWVFFGDDATIMQFATAGCNTFARIFTISAHAIVFDKFSSATPASDAGTGKTIRMFFGRYIKNESDPSLIVRTTYNLERTLGKADSGDPDFQAEYINGCAVDTTVLTFNSADKATIDYSFVGTHYATVESTVGQKGGTRQALTPEGAYNTSTDLVHINLHVVGTSTPLYAYVQDASVTIDNNISPNKALSVLGAFDLSPGLFQVSATATAYFVTVDAAEAISQNSSVTMDFALTRDNAGMVFDLPLVTLGGGENKVAANTPITLALTIDAASASAVSSTTDYTASATFFDYLPSFIAPA